jgi:hypothetical protein
MIWKPVVGHENFYEISDGGDVRVRSRLIVRGPCRFYAKPQTLVKSIGGRANNYDNGFNNALDNLYWGTSEQNQEDKARNKAAAVETEAEPVPF